MKNCIIWTYLQKVQLKDLAFKIMNVIIFAKLFLVKTDPLYSSEFIINKLLIDINYL